MLQFTTLEDVSGWFKEAGPDYDTVFSSRVRLSRNLTNHVFPGTLTAEEEEKVQEEISRGFSKLPEWRFACASLSELKPLERRMLFERNLISQDYSLNGGRAFFYDRKTNITGTVNEVDHLRLAGIHGGLSLKKTYREVNSLDTALEKELDFAVSMDWGYINSEVPNIGTGLRASVMVHLPALIETDIIEKAFKSVMQLGFSIKGFLGNDDALSEDGTLSARSQAASSLGNIYQISNQLGAGLSEEEILEKLEVLVTKIVESERKARQEMVEKRGVELEDSIFRAYGILTNCRTIGSKEAIELLLSFRLGVALDWFKVPMETVTALLFLTQKSHIQQLIGSSDIATDTKLVDYTRAQFIQKALGSAERAVSSGGY